MTAQPNLVKGILYPFQQEDTSELKEVPSVLLAWEMGTGKTFAGVELDLQHRVDASGLTLVVAPLSVLPTWEDHFNSLAPHLTTTVVDPKARARFVADLKARKHDVYICHWEVLRLIPELREIHWLHIIADEVHRIKNRKAQQTRALKALKTEYKTGLSGTPVTNRPYDLYSILNWLYPHKWKSYWKFYNRYCEYEIQYPHGYHKFLGTKNTAELHSTIDSFYRRHLKRERCCIHHPEGVQPQLPPKYYTTITVDLSPKQRKAYDQMRKDMIAWVESQDDQRPLVAPVVIAQLIRLQQFAVAYADVRYKEDGSSSVTLTEPSSKIDTLMELIRDNDEEQIVVFSQFKQVISLAADRCEKAGISYVTITGDVSSGDRREAVKDFQEGRARIFLGTIGAGGEGITLTSSSTVVFLDRDWSPAKNAQAEDRLHRIGQKDAVQVIDIVARNTVDLGKHQKLELKKKWIRSILGDG